MKRILFLGLPIVLLLSGSILLASEDTVSSDKMPFVYDKENAGADVPKPDMSEFSELESIPFLPAPFMHESGGGGTISWQYSDMIEKRDKVEVEILHAQQSSDEFPWYGGALRQFNNATDRLPIDHHELIAMIAPRAVLMIESTMIPRMGDEAARINALAAKKVYQALGVPERIGVTEDNVMHYSWSQKYTPVLEAYLDTFLLGKEDGASTGILQSRFTDLDTET